MTLSAGATMPVTISVPALGRGFAAAKSTLSLKLRWSTAGTEGVSSRSVRLGP